VPSTDRPAVRVELLEAPTNMKIILLVVLVLVIAGVVAYSRGFKG
jgi:hypothetical protein